MATDYIVFIHGVNTREKTEPPTYADALFTLIQKSIARKVGGTSVRQLVKVPLYWGSEGVAAENALLQEYQYSPEKYGPYVPVGSFAIPVVFREVTFRSGCSTWVLKTPPREP